MKVVIIGAGPAGLVTCKTLLDSSTEAFPFDPIVLEQEDDIGGTFRYRSYEVRHPCYGQWRGVCNKHVLKSECYSRRIPTWCHQSNLPPSLIFDCPCPIQITSL